MSVKTERQHAGEFLVSEGPGTISREAATLKSGQSFAETKDGRVLKDDGAGLLIVAAGTNDAGVSSEPIRGVLVGDVDASAGNKPCVIITRLAEVKAALIRLHAVSGGGAANATLAVTNALKARHVVPR